MKINKRNPLYYKQLNPNLTDLECEELAKKFKQSCNYNSIEYYKLRYPQLSEEEQYKLLEERRKASKKNNPSKIEYYIEHFPELSLEECRQKQLEFNKARNYSAIEYYQRKYPHLSADEQEALRQEAIKRADVGSKIKGQNNGMSRSHKSEDFSKYCSPMCIEFYEKRYPYLSKEEQLNMFNEFHKKISEKTKYFLNNKLECLLNKGLSIEDAKNRIEYLRYCAAFSLEKCIEKYGEKEGKEFWENRQRKWKESLRKNFIEYGDGRSPQSKFAKKFIIDICKYFNIDIPTKEKYITKNKKHYAYDLCIGKAIIEFQGDFWHCNPTIYSEDFINNVSKLSAKEIWYKDELKKECAESLGYSVLYIWESDSISDYNKELNKCISFINNVNNNL